MQSQQPTNYLMNSSQAHSISVRQFSNHSYHSLPPLVQPILLKYRNQRPINSIIIEQSTSIWCSIFGSSERQSINLCKCQKTQDGYCSLIIKWISQQYDWKKDHRFVKTYQNYTKRNIELFLTDQEISNRIVKKLQILGVKLGQYHLSMLIRICKNYMKHTIYYSKSQKMCRENDIWMWFVIGVYYHIGTNVKKTDKSSRKEQQIIFWSLDIVMNKLQSITRSVISQQVRKILQLIRDYFPKYHSQLVNHYRIDLQPIIYEWTNEFLIGYMGIDSIAFLMDCLLKIGWTYIQKLILSYFEKRMQKMQHDELFQTIQDKQVICKQLLNCSQQWPLIFCNAGTFCFNR